MPNIIIPVQDSDWPDTVAAFSEAYTYQTQVPDPAWTPTVSDPNDGMKTIPNPAQRGTIPNPITPDQYVSVKVGDYVLEIVTNHLVKAAQAQAAAQVTAALEARAAAATANFQKQTGIPA